MFARIGLAFLLSVTVLVTAPGNTRAGSAAPDAGLHAETCAPVPAGLVSWWPGDGNARDLWDGNNGRLLNGATFASGEVRRAFQLDGVDDCVLVRDSASLRPSSLTIEGWINFSLVPGSAVIFGKAVGTQLLDSYAVFYYQGILRAYVGDAIGTGNELDYAWTPSVGTWYHVAYTFDATTLQQSLYLNGVSVATGTSSKLPAYDSHPVLIGADTDFGVLAGFFPGSLDEISFYNRGLSGAEILAIYNAGTAGKCRP
jgi:Concanavalin A-like lectin/glucanases superfamily